MKAADAQKGMLDLEAHPDREYNTAEYMAWLLSLDDTDDETVGRVMMAEVSRAKIVAMQHYYKRIGRSVAIGTGEIDAMVAFMQGATFAAAALGAQPEGKPGTP